MQPDPYQERYDWDRRMWTVLCCGALAVLVAIDVPMPLLPTILLFGCGLLILVWGLLHRRVALRVDAAGVTLGGSPLHYRAGTVLVPWPDIVAILLWQQILPSGALVPQLGVQRRQDEAPQLTTRAVPASTWTGPRWPTRLRSPGAGIRRPETRSRGRPCPSRASIITVGSPLCREVVICYRA